MGMGSFESHSFFSSCFGYGMLRFNLMRVEIRELRPEVIAEGGEVLVHYRSRTNV